MGWSNTSLTARDRALEPSSTARTGRVTSRPRSRRPTIRDVTRVAFSVEPSSMASGTFTPSTMNATRSTPDRSALINSVRACSVAFTNRRETADLLVDVASAVTCSPTGSRPTP